MEAAEIGSRLAVIERDVAVLSNDFKDHEVMDHDRFGTVQASLMRIERVLWVCLATFAASGGPEFVKIMKGLLA